jgi:hypothetical protein
VCVMLAVALSACKPSTTRKLPVEAAQSIVGPSKAKRSRNSVIPYRVVTSKSTVPRDLHYAITAKHQPADQELIDLAIELRSKYPSHVFIIVDSASGLDEYDAWMVNPNMPEPEQYATKHYFAIFGLFPDPPAGWKLVTGQAHPMGRNQVIAVLDANTEIPSQENE